MGSMLRLLKMMLNLRGLVYMVRKILVLISLATCISGILASIVGFSIQCMIGSYYGLDLTRLGIMIAVECFAFFGITNIIVCGVVFCWYRWGYEMRLLGLLCVLGLIDTGGLMVIQYSGDFGVGPLALYLTCFLIHVAGIAYVWGGKGFKEIRQGIRVHKESGEQGVCPENKE